VTYGLGLLFSLKTHKSFYAAGPPKARGGGNRLALGSRAGCPRGRDRADRLVSEIFVESVQVASLDLGMSVRSSASSSSRWWGGGGMTTAFSAARKNRLNLSVSIALGSASQIALLSLRSPCS